MANNKYDERDINVTNRVECHQNGKRWDCDCGNEMDVAIDDRVVECDSCGRKNVDAHAEDREELEEKSGQTTLGAF